MNSYEIDEAAARFRTHPVLGPATKTLANLRDAADRNSDGWAHWPKPARSAARLIELIEGDGTWEARRGERSDATVAALRKAYSPIRAMLTRTGLQCELVQPDPAHIRALRQLVD